MHFHISYSTHDQSSLQPLTGYDQLFIFLKNNIPKFIKNPPPPGGGSILKNIPLYVYREGYGIKIKLICTFKKRSSISTKHEVPAQKRLLGNSFLIESTLLTISSSSECLTPSSARLWAFKNSCSVVTP